jgi:hypothetical protein
MYYLHIFCFSNSAIDKKLCKNQQKTKKHFDETKNSNYDVSFYYFDLILIISVLIAIYFFNLDFKWL